MHETPEEDPSQIDREGPWDSYHDACRAVTKPGRQTIAHIDPSQDDRFIRTADGKFLRRPH